MVTAIVILALTGWAVLAIRSARKNRSRGCCGGNCAGCKGCQE